MNVIDWRRVEPGAIARLFAHEREQWLVDLGWDTTDNFAAIEHARTTWGLPGLAVVGPEGLVGLTFFFATASRFDIGGLWATSRDAAEHLLRAVTEAGRDAGLVEGGAFVRVPPYVVEAFQATGFTVEPFHYLSRTLRTESQGIPNLGHLASRTWQDGDEALVADLLAQSYHPSDGERFAPGGGADAWRAYVASLTQQTACGRLLPECSHLMFEGPALVGATLVTHLGPSTAHLAQLAVRAGWQGRGVGAWLVRTSEESALKSGSTRMTLLVSGRNDAAQRLYARRGYVDVATFIGASRPVAERLASAS